MKNKIVGICVCGLLMTIALPFTSAVNVDDAIESNPRVSLDYDFYPIFQNDVTFETTNDFIIEVIEQLDETMYLGYLENITAFGPRVTGSSACHDAGDYIYNELEGMGLEVRFHNWNYGGYQDRNVEATLHGTNTTSDAIYIICGHYDTVANCPGADDDASGVATVLSAAYILQQYAFDHTIRFVAFSGEEQWMLGSHEYAREAYENGDNIVAVLNVDMIGFAITSTHGSKIKVYKNEASKWISDFTINVSEEYYDYIFLDVIPLGESPSDQLYFWEYGYDGVFYHEYEFNYYYHTPQDTIENLNITYATKCSKLILATLASLNKLSSNAPNAPNMSGPTNGITWVEYDFTVVTTDPDYDDVKYYIEWGDGSHSGWTGSYASGEEVIVSHTWSSPGTYEIRAKAQDIYGISSEWSKPLTINIDEGPMLDIQSIKGGLFKVSSVIKNTGGVEATDVNWKITLKGGAFIGKETSGIETISAGGEKTVNSNLILGFGATKVTVTAEIPDGVSDSRQQNGFILLFFINVKPGGI
ncbi:MAG: M28 family peptidase [Thermoplasmatales archaeon]|nr:MAG: M28 family peptidase [Thermoplasmatales archaeon]